MKFIVINDTTAEALTYTDIRKARVAVSYLNTTTAYKWHMEIVVG